MNKPPLWTRPFLAVAIANFLVFTTFYYLLVTLPIYALQDLHGHESTAGLITTVFLISAILTRPLAGRWIGHAGKQTVFWAALAILGAASLFYFVPHSLPALLVLRFFHGIGFGMATTAAGAIVADLVPDERKGEGMGYYGLSLNLGMVIGPFLGITVMRQAGTTAMFTVNAAASLLAVAAALFVRLPASTRKETIVGKSGLIEASAVPVSVVAAYFGLAYSAVISFVSVYAEEIGLAQTSAYFFVVYALVLLVSRPFTGRWFDRYGANFILYPAIVCYAFGTYLLSISASVGAFLAAAALIGLGWGTAFPSLQTIAIQVAPAGRRALATATYLSIFDFGFGVGSLLFGVASAYIGYGALYLYSSILVIAGIGVYYLLHGRGRTSPLFDK